MKRVKREVRNLILMLGSGVCAAFLITVIIVYYFGSSGTYLLRNILVDPNVVMEEASFKSKRTPFIFNKIDFVHEQSEKGKKEQFSVSAKNYTHFYSKVAKAKSLPALTEETVKQFEWIPSSTLILFVRSRDHLELNEEETVFQQIQFLDQGDIFRVQLPKNCNNDSHEEEWVYFSYPGIYKEVMELFAPTLKG
ncbi:MAG: hypothetical protein WAM28_02090 [Chlamydiales bacterium]